MALSISRLQVSPGEYNIYSTGFYALIEDHLTYLQNLSSTIGYPLDPHDEFKYTGDFYQLLCNLKIPQDQWRIILRVNNLYSPVDYAGDLGTLQIPNRTNILNLLQRYLNSTTL